MKIGYLSDTHIDFFIKDDSDIKFDNYIKSVIKPEGGDVLIVAGDISHYNSQIKKFLEKMTEYYNQIVFVYGNHDLYLISNSQKKLYKKNSFNRIKDLEDWSLEKKNIHFLNGTYISINGVKIGGLTNWYNLPTQSHINDWNIIMNDSNLIFEGRDHYIVNIPYNTHKVSSFDTQKFRKKQEELFNNLENLDILVTHICPSIIPNEYLSEHTNKKSLMFYMTDDMNRVKKTGAKYVVYGHNHTITTWNQDDINFLTNSIGYPNELIFEGIKHFNIV